MNRVCHEKRCITARAQGRVKHSICATLFTPDPLAPQTDAPPTPDDLPSDNASIGLSQRLFRKHVRPLLDQSPSRRSFLDLIPYLLKRLGSSAIVPVSWAFYQKFYTDWPEPDQHLWRHIRDTKAFLQSAVLDRNLQLNEDFPTVSAKFNDRLRDALPIMLYLAAFRGTDEFTRMGFFLLSAKSLSERLFLPHPPQASRIILKARRLCIIRLAARGLTRRESFAMGYKPQAAGYQLIM